MTPEARKLGVLGVGWLGCVLDGSVHKKMKKSTKRKRTKNGKKNQRTQKQKNMRKIKTRKQKNGRKKKERHEKWEKSTYTQKPKK